MKGVAGSSVGKLTGLEIRDDLIAAIHEAVAEGEDGVSFKDAAEMFGLSYHSIYSAVHSLVLMGAVAVASRADRTTTRIALPTWQPPERLDLTAKQRGALDYLVSVMDDEGIAYTSFKAIASAGPVAVGGIVACLDALDKKGYISILLRGKGARRTLFQVFPDGDGPRRYSPFHHGMIEAPGHLGVPCPPGFARWANGRTVEEGVKRYSRCVPVVRRWFAECDIQPKRKERESAPPDLAYPFLASKRRTPERELLQKVNGLVPRHLPPDRRADICQDLLVAILCGDMDETLLDLSVGDFVKRVLRQFPTQFGDLSLETTIGDTDLRIMDTLAAEPTHWDYA